MTVSTKLTVCTVAVAALAGFWAFIVTTNDSQADQTTGLQSFVEANGDISLPDVDYRKDWTALGAWAVADDEEAGSKGMHVVYSQPDSVAAYRKTGSFPDGAVLIKELFATKTQDMTTGTVSRAGETEGWFVMIKDTVGRFPNSELWGDGWGWAYFDAEDRITTTTGDYLTECKGCHVPAKDTDWIYTDAYPVLHQR